MVRTEYSGYRVWDAPTRWFHWINVLTVVLLIFTGFVLMFRSQIGLEGGPAKIALKKLHVWIGYVFMLNLSIRILWGFFGNEYARWASVLPSRDSLRGVAAYIDSWKKGSPRQYIGHNPLGRLAVTLMFFLLIVIGLTGLIRAGTDIYYPPFGGMVAGYVVVDGADPASLVPGSEKFMHEGRSKRVDQVKQVTGWIHIKGSYVLMFMIVLHVYAVVAAERYEGINLVSAMISGNKLLTRSPDDINSRH